MMISFFILFIIWGGYVSSDKCFYKDVCPKPQLKCHYWEPHSDRSPLVFWVNLTKELQVYDFDYCDVADCRCYDLMTIQEYKLFQYYICATEAGNSYCSSWSNVITNTGEDWGYRPHKALKSKDEQGKNLIHRMRLFDRKVGKTRPSGCQLYPNTITCKGPQKCYPLTLTLQNPQRTDLGMYVLRRYPSNYRNYAPWGQFYLKDLASRFIGPTPTPGNPLLSLARSQEGRKPYTVKETLVTETGFADHNVWLDWVRYTTAQANRSACITCAAARPHLGTVPLHLPRDHFTCFLGLYTNSTSKEIACEQWKNQCPLLNEGPKIVGITIYKGNDTCFEIEGKEGKEMGKFPEGYCGEIVNTTGQEYKIHLVNQTQALGDIVWICADMKLRTKIEVQWHGQCALAMVLVPFHIFDIPDWKKVVSHIQQSPRTQEHIGTRGKRETIPGGSLDAHVYIDAIGVPRGVPDEFKAQNQVAAGFESIFPIIVVNKNVDWINYIYYNQQRFVNYTWDALKGIIEQLGPTSTMAFHNRMALDMLLAEKGGVCKMIGETCCTVIPDNLGPNGQVMSALKGLTSLSEELKRNSGIDNSWAEGLENWFKNWKQMLLQIGIIIIVVLILLVLIICCIIPCVKKLFNKAVDEAAPEMMMGELYEDFDPQNQEH